MIRPTARRSIAAGVYAPQTVILESDYRETSDEWMVERTGLGTPVFDRLAENFRVCAYDRPGTVDFTVEPFALPNRTTPVPMPRTAANIVADLHHLLHSGDERGPFILVGHSAGGLFARLYAQTYPADVAGVVFVDAVPVELEKLWGAQFDSFMEAVDSLSGVVDVNLETIDFSASFVEVKAAEPFPEVPVGVLSKGSRFGLPPESFVGFTSDDLERVWSAGQERMAAIRPNAVVDVAVGGSHWVSLNRPDLVAVLVEEIAARAGK